MAARHRRRRIPHSVRELRHHPRLPQWPPPGWTFAGIDRHRAAWERARALIVDLTRTDQPAAPATVELPVVVDPRERERRQYGPDPEDAARLLRQATAYALSRPGIATAVTAPIRVPSPVREAV